MWSFEESSDSPCWNIVGIGKGGKAAINALRKQDLKDVTLLLIDDNPVTPCCNSDGQVIAFNLNEDSVLPRLNETLSGTAMTIQMVDLNDDIPEDRLFDVMDCIHRATCFSMVIVVEKAGSGADDSTSVKLKSHTDCVITLTNDSLPAFMQQIKPIYPEPTSSYVLAHLARSLMIMVSQKGGCGIDHHDLASLLKDKGTTVAGLGCCNGSDRAEKALEEALKSATILPAIEGMVVCVESDSNSFVEFEKIQLALDKLETPWIADAHQNAELNDSLVVTFFAVEASTRIH